MAGKNSEKIKVYLVIALSMIFIISFYFRFIQAKTGKGEPVPSPETPLQKLHLPRLDPSLLQDASSPKAGDNGEIRTVMRDIFFPPAVSSRASNEGQLGQPEPADSNSLPSFQLMGTIVSKERSIAIIDNQFFRRGDRIGEYRITTIGKKKVWLDSGERKIELEMLKNE
jgi:type II secretory pathway component PulC